MHIALLGDSIFDNGAYTGGGPDVISQLREALPDGWQATLLAVDGSLIRDLDRQIERLPRDATLLAISIGGNDVLGYLTLLSETVRSMSHALAKIRERLMAFEQNYRRAMKKVQKLEIPFVLCTIYKGNFSQEDAPLMGLGSVDVRVLHTALAPFNEAILQVAFEIGADVIDLRLVCTQPEDYANPIEPSSKGGEKIARAIAQVVTTARDRSSPSRVFY
jgi:lysophospholipase L1-like esterase